MCVCVCVHMCLYIYNGLVYMPLRYEILLWKNSDFSVTGRHKSGAETFLSECLV